MAKKAQTQIQVIPFATFAKVIYTEQGKVDKAAERMSELVVRTMQQYIDAWAQANGRTEDACKALAKEIKDCELVKRTIELKQFDATTWSNYSANAQRALYWDVAYEPRLFQMNGAEDDPEDMGYMLPWSAKWKSVKEKKAAKRLEKLGEEASEPAERAGRVVTTTNVELLKTVQKSIRQARLLKDDDFAAKLFDLAAEKWPEFRESAE